MSDIRDENGRFKERHGMSHTKVYSIWNSMIQRAFNYSSSNASYYKERGITVCPEWLDFENFYADMGDVPEGLTLERVDNNKDYCKSNCKWDTMSRQASNRRKYPSNKSGRIGVYWREDQAKWRVSIKVDGVRHNLGQFAELEKACGVCREAELSLLGYTREEF